MRWLSSWVLFVVVVLGSVEALARSLTVEQFDARIHVEREGSLLVTETLTVEFEGRWNGLQRFIPLERPGLEGTGELELEVIEVSDGGGEALRFDVSHSGVTMALDIHAPAMNERRTIVIHYRVRNGVRHMRSGHAVFWNITGDRWAAPIRHTTAHVSLPFGAQDISANAFVSSSDREPTTVTATIEKNSRPSAKNSSSPSISRENPLTHSAIAPPSATLKTPVPA